MRKQLHAVMFAGTGSDVGKSVVAAAFCRIFLQDGLHPSPFKAQNMALNSYVTPDGLEIGRAQAVQAAACKLECSADMNPILLKPSSQMKSQVVFMGRPFGESDAYSYFKREGREFFRQHVCASFDRLSKLYNPIVIEGAGSIAEINLRENDIVNMNMAKHAKAKMILVADIDRGGVFASLYGTMMLLTPQEREMIKGIIINKFRGDIRVFETGIKEIERLCQVPVLGVIPYFNDIYIEKEDSVDLENRKSVVVSDKINIAVVKLKYMSNYTDFDMLDLAEGVNLFFTTDIQQLKQADIIIIPGTKNTIADMLFLKQTGLDSAIRELFAEGKQIYGICGGYQILGRRVFDPQSIEGEERECEGIGILPVETIMESEKQTVRREFRFIGGDAQNGESDICMGYEIHMGKTTVCDSISYKPVALFDNSDRSSQLSLSDQSDQSDGYYHSQRCFGTYLHGIFDNKIVLEHILSITNKPYTLPSKSIAELREQEFDKLAKVVRENVDLEQLYKILEQ